MEYQAITDPQGVDLFSYTASEKTPEDVARHKREFGGDLLGAGVMTPNEKMHPAIVGFVQDITTKFGMMCIGIPSTFPEMWQENCEFRFRRGFKDMEQVNKFFEAITHIP